MSELSGFHTLVFERAHELCEAILLLGEERKLAEREFFVVQLSDTMVSALADISSASIATFERGYRGGLEGISSLSSARKLLGELGQLLRLAAERELVPEETARRLLNQAGDLSALTMAYSVEFRRALNPGLGA